MYIKSLTKSFSCSFKRSIDKMRVNIKIKIPITKIHSGHQNNNDLSL